MITLLIGGYLGVSAVVSLGMFAICSGFPGRMGWREILGCGAFGLLWPALLVDLLRGPREEP